MCPEGPQVGRKVGPRFTQRGDMPLVFGNGPQREKEARSTGRSLGQRPSACAGRPILSPTFQIWAEGLPSLSAMGSGGRISGLQSCPVGGRLQQGPWPLLGSICLRQPKMSLHTAWCPLRQNCPRPRTLLWRNDPHLGWERGLWLPPLPPPYSLASVGSGVKPLPLRRVLCGVDMLTGEDREGRGNRGQKHIRRGREINRQGVRLSGPLEEVLG